MIEEEPLDSANCLAVLAINEAAMVGFRGFGDPARSQARWCGLRNGTLGLVPRETPLPVGIDTACFDTA